MSGAGSSTRSAADAAAGDAAAVVPLEIAQGGPRRGREPGVRSRGQPRELRHGALAYPGERTLDRRAELHRQLGGIDRGNVSRGIGLRVASGACRCGFIHKDDLSGTAPAALVERRP